MEIVKKVINNVKNAYVDFYKNIFEVFLKKKAIIIFVLIAFILIGEINFFSSNAEFMQAIEKIRLDAVNIPVDLFTILFNDIFLVIAIILLGTIPYMYASYVALPVLAIQYSIKIMAMPQVTFPLSILLFVSIILKIAAYTFTIAYSSLMCKRAGKNFSLSSLKGYNMFDLKKDVYNATRKSEKAEKVVDKKNEKIRVAQEAVDKLPINFKTYMIANSIAIVLVVASCILEILV